MESVEIVELIKITFKRGKGTEDDPIRVVTQYWAFVSFALATSSSERPHFVANSCTL